MDTVAVLVSVVNLVLRYLDPFVSLRDLILSKSLISGLYRVPDCCCCYTDNYRKPHTLGYSDYRVYYHQYRSNGTDGHQDPRDWTSHHESIANSVHTYSH